jgi:hypothetical protein
MSEATLDVIVIGGSSVDLYGAQVGGRLEDIASFRKRWEGVGPTSRLALDRAAGRKARLAPDKAGISADYAVTANIHINAGLDYVNFAYGESGPSPYKTVEPHSTTSNLMLKVGLGYAF